jgi:ATP adenylyltransferase
MKYIQEHHDYEGCIFCLAAEAEADDENLIFSRGHHTFMILNRYPYTSGHVMCVPYAHVNRLHALKVEARAEMMEMVNRATQVLQNVYQPDGFNVGLNLGEMAGAGIAEHIHFHVVPRWGGDTNFISTVGETRILPEALDVTLRRVKAAWESFED